MVLHVYDLQGQQNGQQNAAHNSTVHQETFTQWRWPIVNWTTESVCVLLQVWISKQDGSLKKIMASIMISDNANTNIQKYDLASATCFRSRNICTYIDLYYPYYKILSFFSLFINNYFGFWFLLAPRCKQPCGLCKFSSNCTEIEYVATTYSITGYTVLLTGCLNLQQE